MNRYQSSTPRAVAAAVAIAMTVLTVGVAVIAPAKSSSSREAAAAAVTAAAARQAAPIEVVILPARIDVIGYPEKRVAVESGNAVPAKRAGEPG